MQRGRSDRYRFVETLSEMVTYCVVVQHHDVDDDDDDADQVDDDDDDDDQGYGGRDTIVMLISSKGVSG